MKKLFKWGKKYIFSMIILISLLVLLQFLFSYLPLFISFALSKLPGNETETTMPKFLVEFLNGFGDFKKVILMTGVCMVCLQAVRSLMRYTSNYLTGKITQDISKDMKIKMYDHITELSYTFHNNADTGDLIQRCTSDIDTASTFIANQFPNLISIIGTVVVGAYQVYQIAPIMMWISLIILPITGVSSIIYFRYGSKLIENMEEKEATLTTVIQENVNGVRVVKAFANEKYETEKMDKANKEFAHHNQKFIDIMAVYWGASDFVVILQYAITIIVGIVLCQKGELSAANVVACLLLMNMLVWPMRGLGRIVSSFGKSVVASKRIDEILTKPSEFTQNGEETPQITGEIEFKNVSFKFEDDDTSLLNNVSFKINKGEVVSIVGKTGSGKSTICNLLTRMLEFGEGEILLDGHDIKKIEKRYLRKNIKMVLQDPFLYSKSVYDNIKIAVPNASEDEVFEVSKLANVYDEIQSFKHGYKTLVGEKGTTLSGGQKQRLAIARILIEDAPVLIFDDSLSALDTKTDLAIREALKERNHKQTMIIITHRTTTAKETDKIIVLNDNTVEAIGTHEELANKDGLYKDLWEIQGKLEEEFMEIFNTGGESNE